MKALHHHQTADIDRDISAIHHHINLAERIISHVESSQTNTAIIPLHFKVLYIYEPVNRLLRAILEKYMVCYLLINPETVLLLAAYYVSCNKISYSNSLTQITSQPHYVPGKTTRVKSGMHVQKRGQAPLPLA